jgi:hypothetical protein
MRRREVTFAEAVPMAEATSGMRVFNGAESRFAGGLFTTRERAEEWIAGNGLTGVLTRYPIDVGVYERAVGNILFTPGNDRQRSAEFIAGFTTASMEHHHYENGAEPH